MKHVVFTSLFILAALPLLWAGLWVDKALADSGAKPIEIDPSYNECFKMAQDALKAEQLGLQMEADELAGADPMQRPAQTQKTHQKQTELEGFLPSLTGDKDFETALRESGAEIIVDPENPQAAPRVKFKKVEFKSAPSQKSAAQEAEKEDKKTDKNLYQQKKDVCRIKYGISF